MISSVHVIQCFIFGWVNVPVLILQAHELPIQLVVGVVKAQMACQLAGKKGFKPQKLLGMDGHGTG